MTTLTMGYPFAFQMFGYQYWELRDSEDFETILERYEENLFSYVYEKLWSELSEKDKTVLKAMASGTQEKIPEIKVPEIMERASMTSGEFSVYRKRLLEKGLVIAPVRGELRFALPRFREFIREMSYFEQV